MKATSAVTSPARGENAAQLRYIVITPARNEEAYIEQPLKSMISQTIRPVRWVIVSDGSTDRTDEIVKRYAAVHDWIERVRAPDRKDRHFAGKVNAFDAGFASVRHLQYDVIGNLDADFSFEPDYVEYLLGKFSKYPRLGVPSTNYREIYWEQRPRHDYRFTSREEVSGAFQLFRRECFESIGGDKPSRHGGIDLIANVEARMHGWQTRVYTGRLLIHHRQQGTAKIHPLLVEFYNGRENYICGGRHRLGIGRGASRVLGGPRFISGSMRVFGHFFSLLSAVPKMFAQDTQSVPRKGDM